jgi:hypothetical protein
MLPTGFSLQIQKNSTATALMGLSAPNFDSRGAEGNTRMKLALLVDTRAQGRVQKQNRGPGLPSPGGWTLGRKRAGSGLLIGGNWLNCHVCSP